MRFRYPISTTSTILDTSSPTCSSAATTRRSGGAAAHDPSETLYPSDSPTSTRCSTGLGSSDSSSCGYPAAAFAARTREQIVCSWNSNGCGSGRREGLGVRRMMVSPGFKNPRKWGVPSSPTLITGRAIGRDEGFDGRGWEPNGNSTIAWY